jgi:hypothetical protein
MDLYDAFISGWQVPVTGFDTAFGIRSFYLRLVATLVPLCSGVLAVLLSRRLKIRSATRFTLDAVGVYRSSPSLVAKIDYKDIRSVHYLPTGKLILETALTAIAVPLDLVGTPDLLSTLRARVTAPDEVFPDEQYEAALARSRFLWWRAANLGVVQLGYAFVVLVGIVAALLFLRGFYNLHDPFFPFILFLYSSLLYPAAHMFLTRLAYLNLDYSAWDPPGPSPWTMVSQAILATLACHASTAVALYILLT